ncbi:hypothetical protein [Bradyrhizobium manausense]|uniref:hypothetical protein n=1 Tax=Bradyrhizobium manausense TaxID=989370 RepID=UPI0012EE631A|nr:hypothetical protein [Bradyrhizobium manausense]
MSLSEWCRRQLGNAAAAQGTDSELGELAAIRTRINSLEAFLRANRAIAAPSEIELHVASEVAAIRDGVAKLIQRMLRRL